MPRHEFCLDYLLFRHFSEINDRSYSHLLDVPLVRRGLFAPLGSDARRAAVLAVLVFEGVRIGQGSQGMVLL